MRKVIAITGGRGFVGRHLAARCLQMGHCVRILSRSGVSETLSGSVEHFQGDLLASDETVLARFVDGADVIYHCAGEILDESRMDAVNRVATSRLASIAAGRVGRWVQLSTAGVYGFPRSGMVDENSALAPCNTYESSKLASDIELIEISEAKGLHWSMLRPTIIFGHDMPNDSVRALIRAIQTGRFFYIGKPGASLPYIHVDDVVEGLIRCGRSEQALHQAYILSENVLLEEFASQVAILLQCRPPHLRLPEALVGIIAVLLGKVPGFPLTASRIDALTRHVNYSSSKISRELGYSPITGWRSGLREMIESMHAI